MNSECVHREHKGTMILEEEDQRPVEDDLQIFTDFVSHRRRKNLQIRTIGSGCAVLQFLWKFALREQRRVVTTAESCSLSELADT